MLSKGRDVAMTRHVAADGPIGLAEAARERRQSSWEGDHMIQEFRDFILRGNVVDLAVAVVIGGAFAAITASLVADILTPLLGLIGIPDFSTWVIDVGDAEMRIGLFLNSVITFLLIALAIFFLVVKPMQRIAAMQKQKEEQEAEGPNEIELLTQIRDELRKQS
jgi:large conductance mechanosensitive channel